MKQFVTLWFHDTLNILFPSERLFQNALDISFVNWDNFCSSFSELLSLKGRIFKSMCVWNFSLKFETNYKKYYLSVCNHGDRGMWGTISWIWQSVLIRIPGLLLNQFTFVQFSKTLWAEVLPSAPFAFPVLQWPVRTLPTAFQNALYRNTS